MTEKVEKVAPVKVEAVKPRWEWGKKMTEKVEAEMR
jgi:hypothetical protein